MIFLGRVAQPVYVELRQVDSITCFFVFGARAAGICFMPHITALLGGMRRMEQILPASALKNDIFLYPFKKLFRNVPILLLLAFVACSGFSVRRMFFSSAMFRNVFVLLFFCGDASGDW
jgi:hypothetical protein